MNHTLTGDGVTTDWPEYERKTHKQGMDRLRRQIMYMYGLHTDRALTNYIQWQGTVRLHARKERTHCALARNGQSLQGKVMFGLHTDTAWTDYTLAGH